MSSNPRFQLRLDLLREIRDEIDHDFRSEALYNPFSDAQRDEIVRIIRGNLDTNTRNFEALIPAYVAAEPPQYYALVKCILAFFCGDVTEVLSLTSRLSYWSETSPSLKAMVEASEYAVKGHLFPQERKYLTSDRAHDISFCVSFPRSGNTMFTNICDTIKPGSRHSVFWSDGRFFSRYANDFVVGTDVLVKDHSLCNSFLTNKILYIVRDFRQVLRSYLVYVYSEMTRAGDPARDRVFASITTFVHWCNHENQFAGWLPQVEHALGLASRMSTFKVVRYEDLVGQASNQAFAEIFAFLGWNVADDDINRARAASGSLKENLTAINPDWSTTVNDARAPYFLGKTIRGDFGAWWSDLTDEDRNTIHTIVQSDASRALNYHSEG